MPRRLLALLLVMSAAWASAGAANASSLYQARVNGVCRGYTPLLKKLEVDVAAAKKAGDVHRIFYDLGYGVALGLRQDAAIQAVPVPASLQTQMAPILRMIKSVDSHARAFLRDAQANQVTAAMRELNTVSTLSKPADRLFDGVGLQDCGSRQN